MQGREKKYEALLFGFVPVDVSPPPQLLSHREEPSLKVLAARGRSTPQFETSKRPANAWEKLLRFATRKMAPGRRPEGGHSCGRFLLHEACKEERERALSYFLGAGGAVSVGACPALSLSLASSPHQTSSFTSRSCPHDHGLGKRTLFSQSWTGT